MRFGAGKAPFKAPKTAIEIIENKLKIFKIFTLRKSKKKKSRKYYANFYEIKNKNFKSIFVFSKVDFVLKILLL